MFFILLSQAIVAPLLIVFNIGGFMTSWKRKGIERKLKAGENTGLTQEEAQRAFELGEFDPSFAYSAFAKVVFTSFFYQPILPLGIPLGLVGLLLLYYAFKKKLLRDSRSPVMISDDIADVTLYLLNLVPFAYGVGSTYRSYPTSSSKASSTPKLIAALFSSSYSAASASSARSIFCY